MELISSLGITSSQYLSKERFISYHHQSRLLFSLGNEVKNVLEIGIFNSLFTEILRQSNYNVTTADIDPNLKPDIILNLTEDFTLPKDKFDAIVLFQVLEHFPYQKSELALQKLATFTKKYLVISIPNTTHYLSLQIKTSFLLKARNLLFKIPLFWSTTPLCDEHYWEMGLKGYPKKRILESVAKAGLSVKEEYIDPTFPYHYFLILEKNK
ncbi:class I SAM-dependent methyltransferase [Dolichospermum sp. ST_sed1]|nr:class I SAM-dependent methyltransferase [Dolichospermum sp. ST_sed1]MDD1423025.1 class I SAM-dependent methyltransferase [Dolichospermum sp. ST_sed9]MDD1430110.1 class I SAM-dependent methyltransferase [Dolichospermum sp. ST_sed6]MDD1435393.1 class I SAM-dependent methyltransferase [Dolichospermum sp. ST_sed10]MDD1439133.1 class I SAM-dependent methyltransferase [Dolichospermum sp. ST_sed3]MDD1444917.1 class I SAM-dependent methyltransferase [Dolichospermum sp. ST_sed8]MDD1453476.1 class I